MDRDDGFVVTRRQLLVSSAAAGVVLLPSKAANAVPSAPVIITAIGAEVARRIYPWFIAKPPPPPEVRSQKPKSDGYVVLLLKNDEYGVVDTVDHYVDVSSGGRRFETRGLRHAGPGRYLLEVSSAINEKSRWYRS